jgi:glyoxylase-like metal-dependent hydrolase (beta-lactamase superfamily II)
MNETSAADTEVFGMPVGPLESNCFLVVDTATKKALLIDPGADPEKIFDWCALHQADVQKILLTHGHGDHIGAIGACIDRFGGVPVGVHKDDADCLTDPLANLSAYFDPVTAPPADFFLEPDSLVEWEGPPVKVLHTPGHRPGSVCFHGEGWIVSGDVLFQGGIGRTDFPRSNLQDLMRSIREKLMTLPPDTVVYPGHGPATTIGHEKETNPFLHLG